MRATQENAHAQKQRLATPQRPRHSRAPRPCGAHLLQSGSMHPSTAREKAAYVTLSTCALASDRMWLRHAFHAWKSPGGFEGCECVCVCVCVCV